MTTILLARHGETDWNRDGRVQGHSDPPLNEMGRLQALALAEALAVRPLTAVYSSDLARARETAAAVATPLGLDVHADPDLREKFFGSWEGLTDVEIAKRFPAAARGQWGDGETTEDVAQRALAALGRIVAAHPDGTVLVVSHGGAIRAMLHHHGVDHGPIGNCYLIVLELPR